MAQDDYAILVGINVYRHKKALRPLDAPVNDVERMAKWLLDPRGGAVPLDHIVKLTSDITYPDDIRTTNWTPTEETFLEAFQKTVTDAESGDWIKRNSRFYLYFSGHGFCQLADRFPQAALWAANYSPKFKYNIYGSFYAFATREQALFREVVLIMDCCRTAEVRQLFSRPPMDYTLGAGAEDCKVLAVYATPKDGIAMELPFAELGGKTASVLTHVLLHSLRKAPTDKSKLLSSARLKEYMEANWETLGRGTAAPEFLLPTRGDIFFQGGGAPLGQRFLLKEAPVEKITLRIKANSAVVVQCIFTPNGAVAEWDSGEHRDILLANLSFTLELPAGVYSAKVSGDLGASINFEAGGDDVRLWN
jgi:hypothetical protein